MKSLPFTLAVVCLVPLVSSGIRPVEAIKTLGDRVFSVNLKDAKDWSARTVDQPYGQGVADIKGVLAESKRVGFKGHLAAEYENSSDHLLADVEQCIEFVRVEGDKLPAAKQNAASGRTSPAPNLPRSMSAHNAPPRGFTAAFNGQDLTGWWGAGTEDPAQYMALPPEEFQKKHDASLADIREHWSGQDGELVNDGIGLYLTTDKYYGDFELLLDYKTVPLADSGIYLRGCPQVQIWDSTEQAKFNLGADKGSGGLWNNSPGAPGKNPLVKADKPFGEWNHFRIIMAGSRVWVWLNGQQTVAGAVMENYYERKSPVPNKGPIQLQTHGGEIRWRNIFIREIGSDEANKLLRGKDHAGLKPVGNVNLILAGHCHSLKFCNIASESLN